MTAFESVFERFELDLDAGKEPVFHGGERITGFLRIKLKRPMTIKLIRLQFKGRATFTGKDGSPKSAEVEKVYFDKDFTLLDRPPGRPEPGHFPWIADYLYSLPFECPLPLGCPTSYESPHAFIRYFVRAVVIEDAEPTANEYVLKQCLMVVAPNEASAKLEAQQPVTAKDTLNQGKCCCRSKIDAEAQLQKSVYSPGENVVGTLKITSKHLRKLLDLVEVRLTDRVGKADQTKAQFSSHRTLYRKQMNAADFQSPTVCFLRIPPVAPSISGTTLEEALKNDVKLTESLSSMTLRMRKKPFLRIEYQVQISIGGKLLLELPITIVAPGNRMKPTYQPFAGGPQIVDERDEDTMKKPSNGFMYTPQYPQATEVPVTPVAVPIPTVATGQKPEAPVQKPAAPGKKPEVPARKLKTEVKAAEPGAEKFETLAQAVELPAEKLEIPAQMREMIVQKTKIHVQETELPEHQQEAAPQEFSDEYILLKRNPDASQCELHSMVEVTEALLQALRNAHKQINDESLPQDTAEGGETAED